MPPVRMADKGVQRTLQLRAVRLVLDLRGPMKANGPKMRRATPIVSQAKSYTLPCRGKREALAGERSRER